MNTGQAVIRDAPHNLRRLATLMVSATATNVSLRPEFDALLPVLASGEITGGKDIFVL